MRNIALKLMYNGTAYHGWQVQKTVSSVCETMEKGLSKVCGGNVKLVGCGRTDAGVHALGQVAHFDSLSRIPPDKYAYALNTMLVSPDVMLQILQCPEFQNPLTGLNFTGTGEPGNPLGAKLIKSSAVAKGTMIGLDKSYALEMIEASDVAVEYDRLIDRQLERAAITSISGFSKLYTDASKVLTV